MTSTLTPTVSFWALHSANRPLLELRIHEDHLERREPVEPSQGNPADPHTSRLRRPPARRAMTGLRRVISAFRHANAELILAVELMRRPADAPQHRPSADPPAGPDAHQAATGGRADRAA